MRDIVRLSLLLFVSGGAAPVSSLPTLSAPRPMAVPMSVRFAEPRRSAVAEPRRPVLIASKHNYAPAPQYQRGTLIIHPGIARPALVAAEPELGPAFHVLWAAAAIAASVWFATMWAATTWLVPLDSVKRGRWLRMALACSRLAFTGRPNANFVREALRDQ